MSIPDDRTHSERWLVDYNLGYQCALGGGSIVENIFNRDDDKERHDAWLSGYWRDSNDRH